jgi:response regulator NasT
MKANADSSKVSVLVITSDMDAFMNLQRCLDSEYALQRLEDANDPKDIGIPGAQQDIVIILRSELSAIYLEGLQGLIAETPMPVILFLKSDPEHLAPAAIRYGITSVVVDGFEAKRVPTLIDVSIERFKLDQALRRELSKSQEELAARKVIERAKGLLMEKKQLDEQSAYRKLRELAMHQSKTIKEVSETFILYSEILP